MYPLNLFSTVNSLLGAVYVHSRDLDVSLPADSPTYQGSHGNTDYYLFPTDDLPLFDPLRTLGVPEPLIDVVEPVFKVVVDLGYERTIPPWEPTPAPLIPPMRLMGALTGEKGQFDGRIEVEHAFDHDRTAPNETDTSGYTMVNASIDWHPFAAKPELTLSLAGNNLFDVEARRSTSLLKDFAPLAGRDIRLTARVGF